MSTFAAYGRLEKAMDPASELIYLKWLWGRRLLVDPSACTPAGHLRHGVLEQLTGEPRPPSRSGKTHRQAKLSPELLRDLNEIQARIEVLSGLGRGGGRKSADVGHVYVLLFSTGVIKVGKAVNPDSRIATHRYHATIHGVEITDGWVSDVHPAHSRTERELIDFCLQRGARIQVGAEYFAGLDFEAVCDFANEAVGARLSAALSPAGSGAAE